MYQQLLNKIIEYEKICLYRHQRPDGDAAFSCFALKKFIESNFPFKQVKLCGFEKYDRLDIIEDVSSDFIKDSLAIVLDVSIAERIDDIRFKQAKEIIVIDHHPYTLDNASLTINDCNVCATCELLTKIIYSEPFKQYKKEYAVCMSLYCGILTDSNGFSTSNTTANSLLLSSMLVKDGNLNIASLNEKMFNIHLSDFQKITKLRNRLMIENRLGFCILDKEDLDAIGIDYDQAKNNVNEFSRIDDIDIWAIFARNPKTNLFDGSIRSRKKIIINKLCEKYNGGGHKNACGVKKLDRKMVNDLLKDLMKLIV